MIEVTILGRLTNDISIVSHTEELQFANFTLAAQRERKNKEGKYDADFIECTTSGSKAKLLEEHTKKGDQILIIGNLEINKYKDENKVKKQKPIVKVKKIKLLSNK